jgi:hypothetical protein
MSKSRSRNRRIIAAVATPVSVLAAGAMVWQASYSAFSGTTRNSGNSWSTGTVALSDDDAGSARFQAANMTPGSTDTKCITVTANASVPGVVKGYAVNPQPSTHGLENHVLITIESGTGGGFSSCTGFTAEDTLVSSTSLATLALASNYANGVGGWAVTSGIHSRTYRITWTFATAGMTQAELDQLQGDQTGIDIQWELQSS